MFILFLGRNTLGILEDARRAFPDVVGVTLIARDGDQLPAPEGLEIVVVEVSKFVPKVGGDFTLIANGGTSAQLLPVVKRLVTAGCTFTAWDLQREAVTQVW